MYRFAACDAVNVQDIEFCCTGLEDPLQNLHVDNRIRSGKYITRSRIGNGISRNTVFQRFPADGNHFDFTVGHLFERPLGEHASFFNDDLSRFGVFDILVSPLAFQQFRVEGFENFLPFQKYPVKTVKIGKDILG